MISTSRFRRLGLVLTLAAALGGGCKKKEAAPEAAPDKGTAAPPPPAVDAAPKPANLITKAQTPQEAVDSADRTAEDKALDAGRKPVELLTAMEVKPGQKVAELFAGGGYTVELLARVVGPDGKVFGQNTPDILQKFAEKPWSERLARLASPNIVRVDREMDKPLPPEATNLDLVVMHLVYHDTVAMGVDRTGMNAAVWAALKPGGHFVIVDHASADGQGPNGAATLHRIEKKFVQDEVEQTGFVLESESDIFKNPADTHDWSTSPKDAADKRGTSDRFVLVFKRPVL